MADFSEFHSSKPINKEVAANNDEREGSDFKAVSQKNCGSIIPLITS